MRVVVNMVRTIQRFKALKRKELAKKVASGKMRIEDFTLAAVNTVKRQALDVSEVEVLDHEISFDD